MMYLKHDHKIKQTATNMGLIDLKTSLTKNDVINHTGISDLVVLKMLLLNFYMMLDSN